MKKKTKVKIDPIDDQASAKNNVKFRRISVPKGAIFLTRKNNPVTLISKRKNVKIKKFLINISTI
jgi:hypothetical protein